MYVALRSFLVVLVAAFAVSWPVAGTALDNQMHLTASLAVAGTLWPLTNKARRS